MLGGSEQEKVGKWRNENGQGFWINIVLNTYLLKIWDKVLLGSLLVFDLQYSDATSHFCE